MDIALKYWCGVARPFLGVQHEKKEKQTFSSTFWEEALLLAGFLRDIDSRNHAINPILLAKYQIFIPLPSWCTTDDMTNRQTDRQTIKARGTYSRLRLLSVIIPPLATAAAAPAVPPPANKAIDVQVQQLVQRMPVNLATQVMQ